MYPRRNDGNYYRNPYDSEEDLDEDLMESVKKCNRSKYHFKQVYSNWLIVRKTSLRELEELKDKVHKDQLSFNETQCVFTELGYDSRRQRESTTSEAFNSFLSVTAFLSDAMNGITSICNAININEYKEKFQEIMNKDEGATKRLHIAKSQCFDQYRGIEVIIRRFDSVTFSSMIDKIREALNFDKYSLTIKRAYGNDDMSTAICTVGNLIDNASNPAVLKEVGESIKTYVNNNPAVVDACKATGRAVFSAVDTWGVDKKKNSIARQASYVTNQMLMMEDRKEIDRLRHVIDENKSQAEIETQIQKTIEDLHSEMIEMSNIYSRLF